MSYNSVNVNYILTDNITPANITSISANIQISVNDYKCLTGATMILITSG